MESALAWIGQIASWIGQWIPRWSILDTTEAAVKYRGYLWPQSVRNRVAKILGTTAFDGEMNLTVCGPGIHFYWPAHSAFKSWPTACQTDRLETQTMESSDRVTFIISGTLTYSIEDIALLLPMTYNPTHTIVDLAMTALHEVCCDMSWEDLQREGRRGTLKTKLRNSAQKQLSEYGVKVIKLQINSQARCRVIKISQSTATEEN